MKIAIRPYPEYKDSGQSWLGRVPAAWSVLPNRALFTEVNQRNHPDEQLLSVTIAAGVIKQAHLLANSSKKDSSNEDKTGYKLVRPGDIAYNKMRAWQGAIGVSNFLGIVSPAYVVVRPRGDVNSRYFHYLMRTLAFAKEAERWSYGITSDQWSLRPEDFKRIYCTLPTRTEQDQIVQFLDFSDFRITRFIRAKRRLIDLLNEHKQAIIRQAVTCGPNPDVRLKPSGVEWLGNVPEHWDIMKLKHVSKVVRGKFTHRPRNDPALYDGPYPFIQTGAVAQAQKFITSYEQSLNDKGLAVSELFPKGTLVMTIAANIGDVAILDLDACFPDSVVGFVPTKKIEREFLFYVLRSMNSELVKEAPVNTQGNLNVERVGAMVIPVPPAHEQIRTTVLIEQRISELDSVIHRSRHEIELVREYRTRLIADVVTGKLDVRDVALPALGNFDQVDWFNEDDDVDVEELIEDEEIAYVGERYE